jgi:hypothetical protein
MDIFCEKEADKQVDDFFQFFAFINPCINHLEE